MYRVTSQLLAGAILIDGNQALLLNGVESVDVHQSMHTLKTFQIPKNNTWVELMNVLVISSLRIDDSKLAPEVGLSTNNCTPPKNTRVFYQCHQFNWQTRYQ
ncbi:unnamed protein product [Mucor hiemalis]